MNKQTPAIGEQDIVYSFLADLERSARAYTMAVTESNCPEVRQVFEQLLQITLKIRIKCFILPSRF